MNEAIQVTHASAWSPELVYDRKFSCYQRSDGAETTSLPAHPPRPKRFCSSQGIITPPTQSTILSRAKESVR